MNDLGAVRRPTGAELEHRLDLALDTTRDAVRLAHNTHDSGYFALHEARFRWTARRLASIIPPGSQVLEFGSHYLHQTAILASLGYRPVGMDLGVFSQASFVQSRAAHFGIDLRTIEPDSVIQGTFLPGEADRYDYIIFCETLEHLTFNPIAFWRRMHELLRVGGVIYITTPNAFKLLSVIGATRGLLTGRRLGLGVPAIFRHVTYGHHWKEYSGAEIREYFSTLSPDFSVRVRQVHVDNAGYPFPDRRPVTRIKDVIRRLGNSSGLFAELLEATVTLTQRTPWLLQPPTFT